MMRPPKVVTCVVLALTLIQSTGCYSYRPLRRDLPPTWQPGAEARFVRVELQNGETLQLMRAYQDSAQVTGFTPWTAAGQPPEQITLPATAVVRIEERYFSWKKATLSVGTTVVLLLGVAAYAVGQAMHGG